MNSVLGQILNAKIDALKRRFDNMLARGTVDTVQDNKLQHMTVRLMHGEKPREIEHFQQYGFTARPHAGAEVIVGHVNGNRDHGFVVAFDDRRYRLKGLKNGEVALYDDQGQKVVIGRDGIVVETAKTVTIKAGVLARIDAPTIELEGFIKIKGHIVQEGGITSTGNHVAASHV